MSRYEFRFNLVTSQLFRGNAFCTSLNLPPTPQKTNPTKMSGLWNGLVSAYLYIVSMHFALLP